MTEFEAPAFRRNAVESHSGPDPAGGCIAPVDCFDTRHRSPRELVVMQERSVTVCSFSQAEPEVRNELDGGHCAHMPQTDVVETGLSVLVVGAWQSVDIVAEVAVVRQNPSQLDSPGSSYFDD